MAFEDDDGCPDLDNDGDDIPGHPGPLSAGSRDAKRVVTTGWLPDVANLPALRQRLRARRSHRGQPAGAVQLRRLSPQARSRCCARWARILRAIPAKIEVRVIPMAWATPTQHGALSQDGPR